MNIESSKIPSNSGFWDAGLSGPPQNQTVGSLCLCVRAAQWEQVYSTTPSRRKQVQERETVKQTDLEAENQTQQSERGLKLTA